LFEPICTAVLLAATSAIHVIRIHAIYDKNRNVLALMSALYAIQIVVTAVSSAFYRSVPLLEAQGCIAGPKQAWVGIYWIAPTLLYTVSFGLALMRSIESLKIRPLNAWKLMLRDGLNLYGAIFFVNLTNVLFWFIIRPTGEDDSIRTIVTSMAAVLTTSMSLRIILSVRGSLNHGGSFALSDSSAATASRSTQGISVPRSGGAITNISTHGPQHTYTLDEMRTRPESRSSGNANDIDAKSSVHVLGSDDAPIGVKVTVDREIGYDEPIGYKQ